MLWGQGSARPRIHYSIVILSKANQRSTPEGAKVKDLKKSIDMGILA